MRRRPKNELDSNALSRLSVDPGLCATCVHLRLLSSPRSVFLRCGKAEEDPAFARYPPLPVRVCSGYRRSDTPEGKGSGEDRP